MSINGYPLDKTVSDTNLFCWFRYLERVSFFVPAEREKCMTDKTEEINITFLQKVAALGVVVLIATIIFAIVGAISGHPTVNRRQIGLSRTAGEVGSRLILIAQSLIMIKLITMVQRVIK